MTRDTQEQRLPRKSRRWVKFLAVLLACVLLLFLVRSFFVDLFEVHNEGMLPTIGVGDQVLVDKIIYRLREPERQDVIVFNSVERSTKDARNDPIMIMRVVGLPGDEVLVYNGVLFVNDERQEEPYLNNKRPPDNSFFGPVTVPEGEVFVMGDNRTNSRDSRFFGAVPIENIEGKVLFA
jgi:signal peptidase I